MEFGVLGPLQVNGGDVVLPPKQRVLLAALLLRANRVVPVDVLVDAVWGDTPPASARTTLQGYVKHLRHNADIRVGERVVTRSPGYLIRVEAGELDRDRFTGLCDRARAAMAGDDWPGAAGLFADALALWRGEPLADVPSVLLQQTELPRLAELRMSAVESRVDAELRLGQHGELIAELRQLVGAEPLRERLHGQLMVALYRCGRQAEALEAFCLIDRRLRDELGISPGPELRELHQRILTSDPALTSDLLPRLNKPPEHADTPSDHLPADGRADAGFPPAPAQLPADTADFTGRAEQVRLLCDLLAASPDAERPGAVVISAVAGMGGIGKTALAVHVAHRLRERFGDGQLYVHLRGVSSPLRSSEVLARFLRDLGEADEAIPAEQEERAARYRSLLADRSMLVVLDDARDAAQVRPLLPGGSGCAVLVTSRGVLAGLAGAAQLSLDTLDEDEARDLFTAIVGAPRAAAEPEATATVLARCAGLPLAVRIAGARLASRPTWSTAHLAARLADERDRLAELAVDDLAVRASFAVSYDALRTARARDREGGAHPARVFRLLGLAGMIDLGLPAIAALAGQTEPQVAAALETLADAHLLQSQSPTPDRYRMHDLVRSFAADLAAHTDSAQEQDDALIRMLRWYGQQAALAARALVNRLPASPLFQCDPLEVMASPAQAIDWFETEFANLAAAVRHAADRGWHDIAAQIAAAMWAFFDRSAYWDAWHDITETGLASARHLSDHAVLSWLLNSLGQACNRQCRFTEALPVLTEALEIRRQAGDKTGEASVLNSLGFVFRGQGRLEEGLDYHKSALAVQSTVGESRSVAVSLHNVGVALQDLKRYAEALDYLARALAVSQEIGERYGEALTENSLGEVCLALHRFEESAGHFRRSWAAAKRTSRGNLAEADPLYGLGTALAALGRCDEASDAWHAALPILDRCGDPRAAEVRARLTSRLRRAVPARPGPRRRSTGTLATRTAPGCLDRVRSPGRPASAR